MPAPAIAAPIAALNVSNRTIVGLRLVPACRADRARWTRPSRGCCRDPPAAGCGAAGPRRADRQQRRAAHGKHGLAEQQPIAIAPARPGGRAEWRGRDPRAPCPASSSMARTCHCTEGCSAAKAASRGASHSEATDPLAEIASIGRAPRARSRTASQAVASCAKVASTARSSDFALRRHRGARVAGAIAGARQQSSRRASPRGRGPGGSPRWC